MTQQPYGYPPQQPAGYPPQTTAPAYPPQFPQAPPPQPGYGYPPQQPGYPQQGGYGQPQQPPAQPLAQGGLDEFYSQPSTGGGPGINWRDEQQQNRPIGTTWMGVVSRDVGDGDVQQRTNVQSGAPMTFRDGSPQFQMRIPLKQLALFQPGPDGQLAQLPLPAKFPEGEGAWYVHGSARDELARAMAEANAPAGPPKAGSLVTVTLVQRRPNSGNLAPTNVVQVRYQPAAGSQAPAPAAPPAPQQAQPVQQYAQPQQPPQQPQQPQYAQPGQGMLPPLPDTAYAPGAQPLPPQQFPGQPQGQPVPQQAPYAPPDFDAEQAALLARITGQAQPGAA